MLCPYCSRWLDDSPDLAGQRCACPSCRGQFVVPGEPPLSHNYRYRAKPRDKAAGMVAALLSFFVPGLGQACQGRWLAAVVMFSFWLIGIATAYFLIGIPIAVVAWLWAVVDAAAN